MKRIFGLFKSEAVRLAIGGAIFAAAIVLELFGFAYLGIALYALSLIIAGCTVYYDAVCGILRGDLLDEKFLMSIASIGAFFIGEYREGVAVMLFYLLGELFMHKAVRKSRSRIRSLMSICPDEARVIRNGVEETVDADEVDIGEIIVIRAGERVSCDAEIISGSADADTSSLTGESIPRSVGVGDTVESGIIVLNGVLTARVIRVAEESGAMRIIQMVEEATERKAKEENFITSFSKVYTPIVVALSVLIAAIPPIFGLLEFTDSLYRALMFLVVSCPCALVISVPMAFFGGIGTSASVGILFKGGSSFAPVSKVKTVAFDKTGTLTDGSFNIRSAICINGSEEELFSAMASVEKGSNHPIAEAFSKKCPQAPIASDIKEHSGMGTVGLVGTDRIAVGNLKLMALEGAVIPKELEESTESLVFCAKNGELYGAAVISDSLKPEAREVICTLKALGVKRTVIISGDKKERVREIAESVGIDEAYSELLPENKFEVLDGVIKETDGGTMYVGDGINDAPALTLADVGVAMGGVGSDSAIEASDLVIVSDNLSKLPEAIKIARKTVAIAKQNIVFAIGIKLAILLLGALGIANMLLAVFADVGVAVLAILNSMRTLSAARK